MRCHSRCNAIWSKVWQMCWPRVLWTRLIMSMTYTSQTDEKSSGSISCAKKCKSSDLHVLRITPSSWNRHGGAPPMGKLSTESRSRSGRNLMIDTTLRNTISAFILAVFNPVLSASALVSLCLWKSPLYFAWWHQRSYHYPVIDSTSLTKSWIWVWPSWKQFSKDRWTDIGACIPVARWIRSSGSSLFQLNGLCIFPVMCLTMACTSLSSRRISYS